MRLAFPLALLVALSFASSASAGTLPTMEPDAPSPPSGRLDLVIVTPAGLAQPFERLAAARRRDGIAAEVVTLEAIRDAVPVARDDAERVRNRLRDLYQSRGLRWVLLGGDDGVVPLRRAWLETTLGPRSIPTDQYYACLDGDWNADGDDRWGENRDDDPDEVPELFVGRAPVATPGDAREFVRRTLAHGPADLGAGEGHEAHDDARRGVPPGSGAKGRGALRAVLAAHVLDVGGPYGFDLARVAEPIADGLAAEGWPQVTRLYENHPAWPGSEPETREALLAALERGPDLAVLLGAGAPGEFVAGRLPGNLIEASDLLSLRASGRTHVLTLSTGFCDLRAPDALGRALLRAPRGSAVAVIGSVDLQFLSVGDAMVLQLADRLTRAAPPTLGEALAAAIVTLTGAGRVPDDVRLTTQGTLLLGDPTLRLPHPDAVAPSGDGRDVIAAADVTPSRALPGAATLSLESLGLGAGDAGLGPAPASLAATRDRDAARPELRVVTSGVPGSEVRLAYTLATAGAPMRLAIFDLTGREVVRLADLPESERRGEVVWDARDGAGRRVPVGLYFARLSVTGAAAVQRVIVAR